ncbi:phospholipase A1 [Dysgonomonas sp. PFB1-18]|uniref:phospholipase A n=1 Tax=unclassified Dysgonomonas TaxID=2630389 RepID=UPI002473DCC3|nr:MULTISPECIES: phospholipase A [unclassified Dysgonomonas]MDL2302881.1 phospholipase A [Dysgonomonas sp. OttesenSCG-928-D17]MDH6309592.1 phospholipase A1 [Dysgonomonas sp. PF1-14]MDH6339080.1 phospholipase A1 [Dysgonomonas sp. PF1-16]MDH6380634.1 phospholipase A1 [Dysgonomonas sp. PFB1-18]MDH6398130.1 phospholipase A1 [Dysgonomonas sp. PF1-23]
MPRLYLLTFFIIFSTILSAQDELRYIVDDSLRQKYDKAMEDPNIFKPRHLEITEEQAIKMTDRLPSFAVYRDTYFVTGVPLNREITKNSADATFQISIRQRLTKSVLPFKTFAYLTYTQRSFWDIYATSSPFRDTNYNPGLGLGKYLFYDNKVVGAVFAQIKHESNGRDGDESRSWNYLSLSMKYYFNARFNFSGEMWAPWVDGENNKDLLDYRGLGFVSINYISNKHKWWLSADINPRKGVINMNTTVTAAFRISERSNQYLFARFYQGYGESLLDYNKYTMNVRVGICIKPDFYNLF